MKFLKRKRRQQLEDQLSDIVDQFSDEAKEIRAMLGWGEPTPPAPEPEVVVEPPPTAPVKKPAVKKSAPKQRTTKKATTRKRTTKKKAETKE